MSDLCSALSLAAAEPLAASATTADRWLLLEVPGAWPRDVADDGALPARSRAAIDEWLTAVRPARLQFIRRPDRRGDGLLAFVVTSLERAGEIRRIELDSYDELAELDLDVAGSAVEGSLVLVCGHGSRDRCCALVGTPVYVALAERLGLEEVWISSHQGGHRFAANLLVLPAGLQFGRVSPEDAPFVAARALAGRVDLDRYRGRTCYSGVVQAAEAAVRREAGLEGVAEVELDATDGGVVCRRTWSCDRFAVEVEETEGACVPASCGEAPKPQRSFRVLSVAKL
jgi:hypothetical protein